MTILSGFLSSETLNDHQLIAGYFIKTAAFLAQYDATWGGTTQAADAKGSDTSFLQGKLGDIVNLMVGDVANYDRSSTIFPFMRNLDVYAMHTWADGAANDNVGTNLESSSEALNFDSGLILWGQATGNRALRDLGIYLYTTELEGAQTYWLSIKNKTDPFGNPTDVIPRAYLGTPGPTLTGTTTVGSNTLTLSSANAQVAKGQTILGPGIAPNTRVSDVNGTTVTLSLPAVAGAGTFTYTFGGTQRSIVTKLNSNGGAYVGFIGFQTSRVTGIQILPLGGGAYYMGQDANFVAKTYELAQTGATAPGVIPVLVPTYQSLLLPYLALSDPDAALTLYKQNINAIQPVNPLDLVDNNAFNIHWIEGLQAYGHVDATVHADTISYAVFNKNGRARTSPTTPTHSSKRSISWTPTRTIC